MAGLAEGRGSARRPRTRAGQPRETAEIAHRTSVLAADSRQEPDSPKPVVASDATGLAEDGQPPPTAGGGSAHIRLVLKAASEHELHLFKPGSSETPRSGHLWPGSRKVDGLPATATLTDEEMPARKTHKDETSPLGSAARPPVDAGADESPRRKHHGREQHPQQEDLR
jgi:hypothetical protein